MFVAITTISSNTTTWAAKFNAIFASCPAAGMSCQLTTWPCQHMSLFWDVSLASEWPVAQEGRVYGSVRSASSQDIRRPSGNLHDSWDSWQKVIAHQWGSRQPIRGLQASVDRVGGRCTVTKQIINIIMRGRITT